MNNQEIKGRPLSEAESRELILAMNKCAEKAPILEFTEENWKKQFGEHGFIITPIGTVKMGNHQMRKKIVKKRTSEFGMIAPTLSNPDVIVEEISKAGIVLYINKTLSPNSSDRHLAENQSGLPDLLPTQGDNARNL